MAYPRPFGRMPGQRQQQTVNAFAHSLADPLVHHTDEDGKEDIGDKDRPLDQRQIKARAPDVEGQKRQRKVEQILHQNDACVNHQGSQEGPL
ncbi:MAG: hypothetical protein ORN49_07825 [Rhodobacteraceae bacterium]|nr:hypothetical protein [Paracoccaceae bacterium]